MARGRYYLHLALSSPPAPGFERRPVPVAVLDNTEYDVLQPRPSTFALELSRKCTVLGEPSTKMINSLRRARPRILCPEIS